MMTETQITFTVDDSGNSDIFKELFGKKVQYNYTEKEWYCWSGARWEKAPEALIMTCIDSVNAELEKQCDEYAKVNGGYAEKEMLKHLKYSRSQKGMEACEKNARHKCVFPSAKQDRNKMMFNAKNGTLIVEKNKLVQADPEWYITKLAGTTLGGEDEKCPVWLGFLNEIFAGDTELVRFVQKAVGYSMTGKTTEQCLFFLYGGGSNGKSTFLNTISEVFGDYALNIQPQTVMEQKFASGSTANPDVARLKGARLVTTVEPNEGERLNEGLIKQLTGGDTITARFLYGKEFQFRPEFKLWIAANNKPVVRGSDFGIWRRIRLIPFDVTIPPERADKELPQKLKAEYPAILRWCLEGCRLWLEEGLGNVRAVEQSTAEYRMEMDTVSAFIDECCEKNPHARAKSSTLYAAYKRWCEDNGRGAKSAQKFGAEFGRQFQKVNTGGVWYLGVALKYNYGS